MTPTTEKQPEVVSDEQALQKNIARAMEVIGKVARLYKRHGNPPTWVKRFYHEDGTFDQWAEDKDCGSTPFNHAWKRAIRLNAWRHRPVKRALRMRCATCGGWFVGPTNVRCQCPAAKPQKHVEEE